MDLNRYHETLKKCSLSKDLEMLPFGDLTVIGERGVNLSGGQKQRVQLARALYQNSDIYLLDDPFSSVDAHTATNLFNQYVKVALSEKTVLLVTHQADFLSEFDSILLVSEGKILKASYHELLLKSEVFRSLVNKNEVTASQKSKEVLLNKASVETLQEDAEKHVNASDQLIKQEERETGDAGINPHLQYLKHGNALLYFSLSNFMHCLFLLGQFAQSCLLAVNLREYSTIIKPFMIALYALIGCCMIIFLFGRTLFLYLLSLRVSSSIFSKLLKSLFRAPMSFYDSTPSGRILSRVSSDLSAIDLDIPLKLSLTLGSTIYVYFGFVVFVVLAWQVLLVIIPTIYLVKVLQVYYYASARELKRLEGITKSQVASHFAETATGGMTIRAFGEENQFFVKALYLLDNNASASFHSFSANEWCILYLETMYAIVISASAFFMTMLPHKDHASGFIAMALMYGLTLSSNFTLCVQSQCDLANMMVSMERLEQYMHITSEAPEIIDDNRTPTGWPFTGQVEISDLKVRYRPNAPFVLRGISCVFEGGHKFGIVGRTGCGKTTLVSTLFRLVEPSEGRIVIDGIDISTIGLHDLRSHFGIIPQEPILFHGSVRFNLDPLSEHSTREIWEVNNILLFKAFSWIMMEL
ncbi:ABC transporter C family member 10 [Bienertia sinuspersici]